MNLLSLLIDLLVIGGKAAWKDGGRKAESLRRGVVSEREKRSIRSQYAAWAHERGLTPSKSPDVACGAVGGRQICFDTGLGGESERKPKIDVAMALDMFETTLVERVEEPQSMIERRVRTVLDKVELLERIWLSKDGILLVFEPRVHPDVFDAALEALDESLRASPYR
jgi:hypothetical protein